jgi:hypothetical protein
MRQAGIPHLLETSTLISEMHTFLTRRSSFSIAHFLQHRLSHFCTLQSDTRAQNAAVFPGRSSAADTLAIRSHVPRPCRPRRPYLTSSINTTSSLHCGRCRSSTYMSKLTSILDLPRSTRNRTAIGPCINAHVLGQVERPHHCFGYPPCHGDVSSASRLSVLPALPAGMLLL